MLYMTTEFRCTPTQTRIKTASATTANEKAKKGHRRDGAAYQAVFTGRRCSKSEKSEGDNTNSLVTPLIWDLCRQGRVSKNAQHCVWQLRIRETTGTGEPPLRTRKTELTRSGWGGGRWWVGTDVGVTPFFCFRLAIGDEWSVGFSGKRGSARFTGSKHRFSPVFLYFSRFAPRYTATEVVRRPDEDKTVIRSRTRLLHNIGLTLALVCPPTRKTAQSLNQGGRVLNIASYNSFVACFAGFCARG